MSFTGDGYTPRGTRERGWDVLINYLPSLVDHVLHIHWKTEQEWGRGGFSVLALLMVDATLLRRSTIPAPERDACSRRRGAS